MGCLSARVSCSGPHSPTKEPYCLGTILWKRLRNKTGIKFLLVTVPAHGSFTDSEECWELVNVLLSAFPDDMTRVPLGKGKAYINASYIRVPAGKEELFYISTQGPLPCTMNDFWQMVWENHSNVIAMITKEVEHGIAKCHRYWPEPPHSSVALAQFHLQLVNYQILDCFIIRMIEIMNKQHLQFTAWPDHSTPRSSRHLLQFVRYMRKIHRSGPIVTHCSAGVGRSGVLLCLPINGFPSFLQFDIKQIVTHLRHQRFGMIQTKVRTWSTLFGALIPCVPPMIHPRPPELRLMNEAEANSVLPLCS
uniref:Protein tyrosine phosphatase non-receptor type 20 n=1 Tax=Varanus komodoensis TaxID=61221 RepID=A0A8D2IXB2_VARKO